MFSSLRWLIPLVGADIGDIECEADTPFNGERGLSKLGLMNEVTPIYGRRRRQSIANSRCSSRTNSNPPAKAGAQ
jgi:hypothetical protein